VITSYVQAEITSYAQAVTNHSHTSHGSGAALALSALLLLHHRKAERHAMGVSRVAGPARIDKRKK